MLADNHWSVSRTYNSVSGFVDMDHLHCSLNNVTFNSLNDFFNLQFSSMETNTEKPGFVLMLKMINY